MNLKRIFILAAVLVAFIGISANAEDKIGIGYQGLWGGGEGIYNGASVRGWMDELGFDIGVGEWANHCSHRDGYLHKDEDWMIRAQAMYAPEGMAGKNAKCYFGAGLGYGRETYSNSDGDSERSTALGVQPLFGFEYSFGEIPELGFNAQVGYTVVFYKYDDVHDDYYDETERERFVDVGMGVHYYFD
jgi:hypothetical protein